jgi:hypothetical protein
MRTATAVILWAASTAAYADDEWSFVWVGVTGSNWNIVEGVASSKADGTSWHFDLAGRNSVKYIVDASIQGRTVEAGLAAVGSAYSGITILRGIRTEKAASGSDPCGLELWQLHNEYNSLAIKRRLCKK